MKRLVVYTCILLSLSTCNNELEVTPRNYPRLSVMEVSEINESGATFSVDISYRGDFVINQYGFVWSRIETPSIILSDRIEIFDNIQVPSFSSRINTTLEDGGTYYVSPYLITDDFTVFGQTVSFESLGSEAPIINTFEPKNGTGDDIVIITGVGFSHSESANIVRFGNTKAVVLNATSDELTVRVPFLPNPISTKIEVILAGNSVLSSDLFSYTE